MLSEILPFNIEDNGKDKKLFPRVTKYWKVVQKDQELFTLKDCHMFQENATFLNKFSF